jgi:hypothetical protein
MLVITAALAGVVDADTRTTSNSCETLPGVNSSVALANWMTCAVDRFFPHPTNTAWDTAYDEVFSPDVRASFNGTKFDFQGFKSLYHVFNQSLALHFGKAFSHETVDVVAVPNQHDKGGFVYITGREGGKTVIGTDVWLSDAAFAEVIEIDGKRVIIEMRESSNLPYVGPLPGVKNWTCSW